MKISFNPLGYTGSIMKGDDAAQSTGFRTCYRIDPRQHPVSGPMRGEAMSPVGRRR